MKTTWLILWYSFGMKLDKGYVSLLRNSHLTFCWSLTITPSPVHRMNCSQMYLYYYNDIIISPMASQITGVLIIYSTVCAGEDQRKHQSSAPLASVRKIHRWPVNSLPAHRANNAEHFSILWRRHDDWLSPFYMLGWVSFKGSHPIRI